MKAVVERAKRVEHPLIRMGLLHGRGAAHWVVRGHRARARVVEQYLADSGAPRLQVGSGPKSLPGWLNSDLITGDIYLHLGRRLPLPSGAFAYAFGEHVIEHLTEPRGAALLAELNRVLRPGGIVRITTPDLQKLIAIYEDRNPVIKRADYVRFLAETTGKHQERPAQMFNDYLRLWGHRFVYDEEELTAKLLAAGFARVERKQPMESDHELLRGIERHGGEPWVNRAEAQCLEATKAL
jgi:predicted SAM-dependent methyltransferase